MIGVNPNPSRFSFHIGKGLSDSGSGSSTDVLAAVSDCVDNGAHVISMSLGGGGYSTTADKVYDDAYDAIKIAQISWITEYYKKRKRKGS